MSHDHCSSDPSHYIVTSLTRCSHCVAIMGDFLKRVRKRLSRSSSRGSGPSIRRSSPPLEPSGSRSASFLPLPNNSPVGFQPSDSRVEHLVTTSSSFLGLLFHVTSHIFCSYSHASIFHEFSFVPSKPRIFIYYCIFWSLGPHAPLFAKTYIISGNGQKHCS